MLMGLGTVNVGWLKIQKAKAEAIRRNHNLEFKIIAIADSSGAAKNPDGWSTDELIKLKSDKQKVKDLPDFVPGVTCLEIVNRVQMDLLIESSPASLVNGEPGLSMVRTALSRGVHVVLANKTPLVFAFDELNSLSLEHGGRIAYSATVCGGLPVVNVLKRDLKLASLKRIRGIFNATSNFVLREMENGGTLADAVREAQSLGAAEADPSHDLNGHDTANKLFIIMKSFTNFQGTIRDIRTEGIQSITSDMLLQARSRGKIIKLLAEAVPNGNNGWSLSIAPAELPRESFLGSCEGWEMGFEIETDLYEKICMKNYEADPLGTSAAVMRDCLEVLGA